MSTEHFEELSGFIYQSGFFLKMEETQS